jgi:hypothetical protein
MESTTPPQIPPSKFLKYFVENREALQAESRLIGDLILVERIVFPEKKIGKIFIADTKNQLGSLVGDQPVFYRVLLVGSGYYNDETGEDSPLDIKQGQIVLTGSANVKMWSSFPLLEIAESDVLGITRYGDIHWQWENEETFFRRLNDINQSVKATLESQRNG